MDSSVKNKIPKLVIIVAAALMVEAISIFQYERIRSSMEKDMNIRSHMALLSISERIGHMVEFTEFSLQENLTPLRKSLDHPDSSYQALQELIDDNPYVVSACLAFVPDYFPSKGRWFEPYVFKEKGGYRYMQAGGPSHDYFQHPTVRRTMETKEPDWSDAYDFNVDTLRRLVSYAYPLFDRRNRLAAVCGMDMDVTWLSDTLNTDQRFSSSFTFVLSADGKLVAGPPESRASEIDMAQMIDLLKEGRQLSHDGKRGMRSIRMKRAPYWQVGKVYRIDEVMTPIHKMRRQHVLLILLALAILYFMINLFRRNEKKLQEATAEQVRIGGELAVARRIQQEMLPKTFTPDVYGSLEPAREVGGDLFDFYRRDGKLFFCIGDVSGKGVPSAMLMSVVHSLFRVVSQREESPSRVLGVLNKHICQGNDSNMFATFFVGCLDLYSGELRFCNAGHDKPFLVSGTVSLLPVKANLPLGVLPDTVFVEETLSLSPGDTLFLYTDGLTEARDPGHKAFGRSGVEKALQSHANNSPEELVSTLGRISHSFTGDAPLSDDLTMLAIRYSPKDLLHEELTLSNNDDEISRLGGFVKDFCSALDLDRKTGAGLRLALEEAVANVISYAYPSGEDGEITVRADSDHREVRFTVEDSGMPFDPTAVLSADTSLDVQNRPIGGLGILLTRKLTDSVSYCRKKGNNVLTLTKMIV